MLRWPLVLRLVGDRVPTSRRNRQIGIELPTIAAVFPYGSVRPAQPRGSLIPLPFPDHHILQDIPFLL